MRLLLVRNAEHVGYAVQRWPEDDTGLSDRGLEQSKHLASHLADESIVCVFASPATRAVETVRYIAEKHRHSVQQTIAFKALDMGECTGLSYDETRKAIGDAAWDEVFRSPQENTRYFKNGETLAELADRSRDGLDQVVSEYGRDDGAVAIVGTHEEVIGVLLCKMTGMPLSRLWWWGGRLLPPLYASITEVLWKNGQWTLVHFGCTKHLEES
ncbi:MAG: histidine phosphatase family protein [Candidatus Hydrogenedentes bacterium]|nr:histidine phosphatase family protein [Candidatus Hydrogenedentota bacterium]